MPNAKLLPHQWEDVKQSYEQGVSYEQLEKLYGVSQGTIRKRCSLGKWLSPAKLAQLSHEEKLKSKKLNLPSGDASHLVNRPSVAESVMFSLADLEKRHVLPTANWLQGLIQSSREQNLVPAPSNAKELATLTKLFRTELGLDKPQMSLSVNLWGGNNTQNKGEESECIDLEELEE